MLYQLKHQTNMRTQFAHDLRTARRKAGYSQDDIAHLLDTSQTKVSNYERGRYRPTIEAIIDLSLIYGRSFESLYAEVMAERQKLLTKRLASLPRPHRMRADYFNRTASLSRLARRLKQARDHGGE